MRFIPDVVDKEDSGSSPEDIGLDVQITLETCYKYV